LSTNKATHRIILLNFTVREAQTIAHAGYNVERGFAGVGNEAVEHLPYATPHPLYEYDILFYNSQIPKGMEEEFRTARNGLRDSGFVTTTSSFNTPPSMRVSFIGGQAGFRTLVHGGLWFVKLIDADENVAVLLEVEDRVWKIPKLHETLTNLKAQVSSVGKFFNPEPAPRPIWNVPVLASRNGQRVMGYGVSGAEHRTPHYIILPQMRDPAQAAIQILRCLEDLVPELFPDLRRTDWLEDEEFLLPEETAVHKAIEGKIAETQSFIEVRRDEMKALATENAFVRALLTAKEDPDLPPEQRLSGVVKLALEYLDFGVEDIDEKIKTAIKKEDFWVTDGKFLAITEVSGTGNKNPKVKEFNDILGRMATLYKRKDRLVLPEGKDISGLLVLNYDIETHPSKRPRVYIGVDAHITETAQEQKIGILSTVELHKIVMAVKRGILTKDAARDSPIL